MGDVVARKFSDSMWRPRRFRVHIVEERTYEAVVSAENGADAITALRAMMARDELADVETIGPYIGRARAERIE